MESLLSDGSRAQSGYRVSFAFGTGRLRSTFVSLLHLLLDLESLRLRLHSLAHHFLAQVPEAFRHAQFQRLNVLDIYRVRQLSLNSQQVFSRGFASRAD